MQLHVNLAESAVMRLLEYKDSLPRVCHVMNSHVSAVIQGLRGDKGEAGTPGLPGFSGPKGPAVSPIRALIATHVYDHLLVTFMTSILICRVHLVQ